MTFQKWTQLEEKTAALNLRERGILAATTVILVVFLWMQFIYTPVEKKQAFNIQEGAKLNQQIASQSARLVELTELLAHNPNEPLWKQQKVLQEKMAQLGNEIEARLSNLIAPEQMADVMRDVLSDYRGLSLVSARNLPVEPLKINQGNAKKNLLGQTEEKEQAVIFAHGFELTLTGAYFQTLEFLQRLEQMSGFYWRKLDYQVQTYPKATILLQINTLSLEEDWIGV